jgi:hypothetical protein
MRDALNPDDRFGRQRVAGAVPWPVMGCDPSMTDCVAPASGRAGASM